MIVTFCKSCYFNSVNSFDLNSFFKNGFSITHLSKETADRLRTVIDEEVFEDEEDIYGLDNPSSVVFEHTWKGLKHPQAPQWDKKSPFNKVPPELYDFWVETAKSSYFKWFTDLYGDFTHLTVMVHRYVRGDGMGFHNDTSDATWLLNLIYLTDEPFVIEDGGYLGLGRCVVDANCIPIRGTESEIIKIVPEHGLMVTLNNRDPSLLHRVEKLISGKVRRVAVCQMGYIESVLHKEKQGRSL
jgi:hypothetical protein